MIQFLSIQQADGEDELKKRQLMELAIINGTYRDSSTKTAAAGNNPNKYGIWSIFTQQFSIEDTNFQFHSSNTLSFLLFVKS